MQCFYCKRVIITFKKCLSYCKSSENKWKMWNLLPNCRSFELLYRFFFLLSELLTCCSAVMNIAVHPRELSTTCMPVCQCLQPNIKIYSTQSPQFYSRVKLPFYNFHYTWSLKNGSQSMVRNWKLFFFGSTFWWYAVWWSVASCFFF